jgi:hypothetical protein
MKSLLVSKQVLIAGIILLAIADDLNSQHHFGLYIGAGMCKEATGYITTYFKPGLDLNASYNIDFKDHLGFRILAGYKLRGFEDQLVYSNGTTVTSKITNYHLLTFGPDIIFPLYQRNGKLYLLAGLRGNYLFAEKMAYPLYLSNYLDKLQLEADAGIGWEFDNRLLLECIFSGNCLNKGNKSFDEDFKAYDLYFGLGIGYIFGESK